MKPEDKIPSREICKRLFELRITSALITDRAWVKRLIREDGAEFALNCDIKGKHEFRLMLSYHSIDDLSRVEKDTYYPDPDLSEMKSLLPKGYGSGKSPTTNSFWCGAPNDKFLTSNTEPNAVGFMLIILREKGII